MTAKLFWNYDNELGCEVAMHNGYRIRAEQDCSPENPLEAWDGEWPTLVRYDRDTKTYDKVPGSQIPHVIHRFSDEQLVHDQIGIAKALNTSIASLAIDWMHALDHDDPPPNYIHDADALRDVFERQMGEVDDSDQFGVLAALYVLLGIPALEYNSRGHCQGDYAELLIVATPEACAKFGTPSSTLGVGANAHVEAYWEQSLKSTGDLYSAWAWGDVYGYVIEQPVYDEDGEIEEWEEIEHGSCWGYYGDDHAESGLEDAALECVPDEPAPGPPATTETVGLSDSVLEPA